MSARLFVSALSALSLCACADPLLYDEDVALLGLERHEHCTLMWQGQEISVFFDASAEVAFDVHHHPQGDGSLDTAVFLVAPERLSGQTALTFPVASTGEVCLHWRNEGLQALRLRFGLTYSAPP